MAQSPATALVALILLAPVALLASCDLLTPELPPDDSILDAPIEGLTPTQLRVHLAGDEEFGRVFTPADGLGPLFNAASCDQCHPGEGKGHPLFALTRFGRSTGEVFDPLRERGGPQLQNRALPGWEPEEVPAEATQVARFIAPSVTGLGYLEAVDDTTLLRLADPDDLDGDGISGRVSWIDAEGVVADVASLEAFVQGSAPTRNRIVDGQIIGRFGRKASTVNLLHQTVTAYSEDMGLTTDLLVRDLFNPRTGSFAEDEVADPEISSSVVSAVTFYLKTLRVPLRRNADDLQVLDGEALFGQIGCASCHVPTLRTGRSEIGVLDRVEFHPYTDLLLHDMGPELDDGYTEGSASSSEWRTTPLWGLGLSARFQGGQEFHLHDGRATTLQEAIEHHGGEGAASREAFRNLEPSARAALLAFLRSL
ncbi:MAG: di-heme oxidoredictase family protein [Gemmatimonadota bacterium]